MASLIKVGVQLLEALFFAGIIGSAIVVLITGVEDAETALGGGEGENTASETPDAQP